MENNNTKKNKMQEAGALWKRTSKSGSTYLNGTVRNKNGEEFKVIIFSNQYKEEGSSQPDYRIYFDNPITDSGAGKLTNTNSSKNSATEEIPF